MKAFTAFVFFSLSLRVFAVPSLCLDPQVKIISEFDDCHEHEMHEMHEMQKQQPCDHMKQCLTQDDHKEFILQSTDSMDHHIVALDWNHVVLLPGEGSLVSLRHTLYDGSPPQSFYFQRPVYISKSSFLI